MAFTFLDEEQQQGGGFTFVDDYEPPGKLQSAAGRYAQSLYSIPAGVLESIPVGGAALQRLSQKAEGLPIVGGAFEFLNQLPGFREQVQPEERPIYKAGQAVRDFSADLFPYDPEKTGFFQSTLPSGAGSMVGFIGGGALGRAAKLPSYLGAATLGATTGGSESFREATEAGADEDDIYFNTLVNAGLGLSEAVPISRLLNQINRSSGGALRNAIIQGSEEAIQEVFQQVGSNMAARGTFDPERDPINGAGEGGAAGFTLGSLASLVASAIGGRRTRGFRGDPAVESAAIENLGIRDRSGESQPIQFLPEGESALLGAPLQGPQPSGRGFTFIDEGPPQPQEDPDAIQRESQTIPRDVRQPEVPQEVAKQVPPAEGRPQAPQAPIEAEAAPLTGRAAMEERLRQLEAEEASQTAPQIVDPSPKIEELQSLKEPTVDDVRRLFPGSTNKPGGAYDLGDSLSSVEQLESLAKARESMTKGGDPFGRVMMGQFIREAIERATKSGSAGFQMTESAPLDFRQNREVADWLVKNADRIGLSESAVTEIQQNMPLEGTGDMVTLYIGRGGVEGGGQGQSWATTNKQKAASFGTEVTEIQLTKSEADKAKARARQAGQGGDTYFLTKEQFDKAEKTVEEVETPVVEIDEPVLAPEQVLGVGFNPPAAGTSGFERRQAPPGQTLRGPVQEREITAPSRSSLGDYNYVVTTEKERADLADRIVEESRQNFRNAYDRIRNIDDSAFRKVATAAVLADQLERLSKANVADRLELEQHVRMLGSDLKAMKTEGGQALQAENQVNRIVGPYMALLSHMDVIRTRLRKSLVSSIKADENTTQEQAAQDADEVVDAAEKQNKSESTAQQIIDQLAVSQSDTLKWSTKTVDGVRETLKWYLLGDITDGEFIATMDTLKVKEATSALLLDVAKREQKIRELQATTKAIARKEGLANEAEMWEIRQRALDAFREGALAENQANRLLERFAKTQSDTPPAVPPRRINEVNKIVAEYIKGEVTAGEMDATMDSVGLGKDIRTRIANAANRERQIREMVKWYEQRSKIAEQLKTNEEVAGKLLDLGRRATNEKSQLKRARLMKEATDVLHHQVALGKIDMSDLLRDIWYASVLTRGGTLVNILAGGWANGAVVAFTASVDTLSRTRNPLMAWRVGAQFLGGLERGARVGAKLVRTGDYTMLPDYERRAQAILDGKGRDDALERMWEKGGGFAVPGSLSYTRRMIIAADYLFSMPTRDSQLLYAALSRNDQDSVDILIRKFDKAATKQAREQAERDMGPGADEVDIMIRTREIQEEGVSQDVQEAAMEQARRVAANATPRGLWGALYKGISYFPFWTRAPLGLAFIRSTFGLASYATDAFPVIGLASYGRSKLGAIPDNSIFSFAKKAQLDIPIETQRMILVMQGFSIFGTAALAAMFLDDDNEEGRFGMELSGSWLGLSNSQKKALYTAKEKPNAIRFGKGGQWISYKQIPFAGPMAIIGNMRDGQRFRSEEWDAMSTGKQIRSGYLSGMLFLKDMSTIAGFFRMFGLGAGQERLENLEQRFNRMISESVGRFASGFIPSVIKEIDQMMDPRLFRPDYDSSTEYWVQHMPFARKTVGAGPDLNLWGEETKLDRPPFKTWMGSGSDDPKNIAVARIASMSIFPPQPGKTAEIVGMDGTRRQMNEKEFYQYQKLWGQEFKAYIESVLPQLQAADAEAAKWHYDKFRDQSQRIRRSMTPTE